MAKRHQVLAAEIKAYRKEHPIYSLSEVKLMLTENAERQYISDLEAENAKLLELLGDALKTLFYKRLDGSVGCTENCTHWQFGKDCQMVDGCWLELEAAKLGVDVETWAGQ